MIKKVLLGMGVILLTSAMGFAQGSTVTIRGVVEGGTAIKAVAVNSSGELILSGGGSNAAAGATGSAVPSSASYNGLNVSGTLRGQTGTNTSGSVYAADVNLVAAPAIVYNATQPTLTDQQTASDVQITSRGALIVGTGVTPVSVAPSIGVGSTASGAITSAMTGTTSTSLIPATSSNYIYITQCTMSNASTTVGTDEILQDGSGGTTLYTLPNPMASASGNVGGSTFTFPVPLKVPTVGNALFIANVTTGSSTKASCSGFKSTVSY